MLLERAFATHPKRVEPRPLKQQLSAPQNQWPLVPTLFPKVAAKGEAAATKRLVISKPLHLVSTTNMLTYNAPDLPSARKASAPTDEARSSSDESDSSELSHQSRDTLTDASSFDSSPAWLPEENELGDYFKVPSPTDSMKRLSAVPDLLQRKSSVVEKPIPLVPQRKPSHSKRAHQQLARQRSLQHVRDCSTSSTSTPLTRGLSLSSRTYRDQRQPCGLSKGSMDSSHPFNNELQELHEVAEELTTAVRDMEMDQDYKTMQERGLARYDVDDYLIEVQPLYMNLFGHRMPEPVMWI